MIPLNNIAACYIEKKDYQQALATVKEAIKVYESTPGDKKQYVDLAKVYERQGRIYFLLDQLEESIQSYKKSLLENNVPKVRATLKDVEREMQKRAELAYINPALADEHREKGNQFFKEAKFGEAINEYEEAIRRNPKDVRNYTNMSSCFTKLINFTEAKRFAEKALEIEPNNIKALLKQANCFQMLKEYHKAIDAYESILKLDP